MGAWHSKVGSAPFYASVERSLERLQDDAANLKAQTAERQRRRAKISSTIVFYACAIFAALFVYALWVSKQPAGRYSVRGHFLRVAPVFAWPPVAWALHGTVMWLTGWKARRDSARLAAVQARMQKMLSDLKDSTHYERTQAILRKYDPEYARAQVKEREAARREEKAAQAMRGPATPSAMPGGMKSPRLGAMVGSSLAGAGRGIMPALDFLTSTVIGDNPVLTGALQDARTEAEALRQRLASAEAHAERLQRENQELRARLGEPEEPGSPLGLRMLAAPELDHTRGAQAAEHAEAGSQGEAETTHQQPVRQPAEQSEPLLPQEREPVGSSAVEQPGVHADATRTPDTVHARKEVADALAR